MKTEEEREKFNQWLEHTRFSTLYYNPNQFLTIEEPKKEEPKKEIFTPSLELKNWMVSTRFGTLYVSPEVKNLPNEKFIILDLTKPEAPLYKRIYKELKNILKEYYEKKK